MPAAFLQTEGRRWAPLFEHQKPGSPEFSETWLSVAALEPELFWRAQHDFVRREIYERMLRRLSRETTVDLTGLSHTTHDALWSAAVQHGPRLMQLERVLAQWGRRPAPQRSEYELLQQIYDARADAFPLDRKRYEAERQAAQGYLLLEGMERR